MEDDITSFCSMQRYHSITFRNEALLEQLKAARNEYRHKTNNKKGINDFYYAVEQRWRQVRVSPLVLKFMPRTLL